jgi:hypothetical protein
MLPNKCLIRYWENGAMIEYGLLKDFLDGKLQALDILKVANVEVRRTLFGYYPADKIVDELKPTLIQESVMGNKMYNLNVDGIQAKLLRYSCPSTNRQYTKFIEDKWLDADEAMAFHHGYESKEAYLLDNLQT